LKIFINKNITTIGPDIPALSTFGAMSFKLSESATDTYLLKLLIRAALRRQVQYLGRKTEKKDKRAVGTPYLTPDYPVVIGGVAGL
jgi:hypothetical protein